MKLSNKSRYAIRAVFDIAFHARGGPAQIKDISERQAIPQRFLEQIFQELKRGRLVSSKRGPKGGYQLAQLPREIRIGDIVRVLEGPIQISTPGADVLPGDGTSLAITEGAFHELSVSIDATLDSISMEDLCERGESEGVRRQPPRRYVYSI